MRTSCPQNVQENWIICERLPLVAQGSEAPSTQLTLGVWLWQGLWPRKCITVVFTKESFNAV